MKKDHLLEIEDRFKRIYLSAISDVLGEVGYRDQWLGKSVKPLRSEMKLAGPAFTIKWVSDPSLEGIETTLDQEMVESIPKGYIAVTDTGGDQIAGHWGELTNLAALQRGCKGVVVDGGVRDTDYLLKTEMPIFAEFTSPVEAFGHSRILAYQVPISINGVTINPGDYIVGDIDGVIVIPQDITLEILDKCEELFSTEGLAREELRKGLTPTEVRRKFGKF